MAPKTISLVALLLAALSLSATVTVSLAAQTQCGRFSTVSEVLEHYNIPSVLFPSDDVVQSFSCDPAPGYRLVVRLKGGDCTVTVEALGATNVVHFQQEFSATIAYGQLRDIEGLTIRVTVQLPPFGPVHVDSIVDHIEATNTFVQFYNHDGTASPPFSRAMLPSKSPTCDRKIAPYDQFYEDNAVVAEDDIQHIHKYDRILPVVA